MIDGQPRLIDNVKIRGEWEEVFLTPSDTLSELIKGFNLLMIKRESYYHLLLKMGIIPSCRTSESNLKLATIHLMKRINQIVFYCRVESKTKGGHPLRVWIDEDDRTIMWCLYVLDGVLHKTHFAIQDSRVIFTTMTSRKVIGTRTADKRDELFGHCIIGERELDRF